MLCCRDCPAAYIGETGRAFRTRLNDHVSAYTNGNVTKSAFARHLLENNHSGGEEIILHTENKFRRRIALESIEIEKAKHHHSIQLLNRPNQEHIFNISLL